MSFIAATVHPGEAPGAWSTRGRIYAAADRRLGRHDWAIGTYSVADIHLFRLFWRFRNSLNPPDSESPTWSATTSG